MRALAYAAVFGVVIMAASAAAADPWADPAGRFTLNVPHGWRVQVIPLADQSYVKVGNADRECQFIATPDPATTATSPDAVRQALKNDDHFDQTLWVSIANGVNAIFPNNSAVFVSHSEDSAPFFPVQRAEFASPGQVNDMSASAVHAGFTERPGMQIRGFCYTVSDPAYHATPDNPALFDPVLRSMGTASDATLQAAAEAAAAAAAAAPPAPPPSAQHQQGQHH